ncbi:MAG: GNAT family N-acetyltransferase [Xanthomonadaceae bacterium]|nr:GNAT family N-acetyltransferase [Xanthomonadaceae bacterium]
MLATDRLLLRQWQPGDREAFAAINTDTRVMEFFPSILTRAQSDATADRLEAAIAHRGWGFWAMALKSDGRFIGFTGLSPANPELPFAPCVEIGWRLTAGQWRNGYATEAARTVLRFGFEQLKLPEIVAFTAIGNLRSQAVMQRLDMQLDPKTFAHPAVAENSPLRCHCLYRLTAERWHSLAAPEARHT